MTSRFSIKNEKQCMGCMELYGGEFDVCPHCGFREGQGAQGMLHLDPGSRLQGRYIVGKSIGYGGFGVTYIGWDVLLKRKVAIKEYMPSEFSTRVIHKQELTVANNEKKKKQFQDGMRKFIREAEKLAQVGSIDGIVHVFDSFEENNTAYIVMEYLEGETLDSYLKREGVVDELQTMEMMLPILKALDIVHEKGIIHRDIAPDNIFIVKDSEGNLALKLIDFGASKYATTSHSKSLTVIIKPGYSPEEQYRSDGNQGTYTDVYALAAVMYKMITGITPPDAFERRTNIESKKNDLLEEPSKYVKSLSDNFEIALLNAMNVRIEDRTSTVTEFVDELISYEPVKRRGTSIRKIDFMKWPLWAKIVVPTASIISVALVFLSVVGIIKYVADPMIYELPDGMTRVPDIVNEEFAYAQGEMEDAGLVLSNIGGEYSPNIIENIVLNQDMSAGSIVNKNSIVSVRVSTGEENYSLPDVVGYSEEYARTALECMGMEVICIEDVQPGLNEGCVIAQDIEPYTEIKTGQTINLTINKGSVSGGGTVPDLKGLNYEEALDKAASAGMSVVVTEKIFSKEYDNTVIKQNQQAGSTIEAGQAIEVTVALAWREFIMPNLLYKNQSVAEQLLKNIGIKPTVEKEISELVVAGLVMKQDMAADTTVEPEQSLMLTVSGGSAPFEMPSVLGVKEEDAQATLLEKGLAVDIQYGYDADVEEGCVISQSIDAGLDVTRGTEIQLIICSTETLVTVENVTGKTAADAETILKNQGFKVLKSEAYSGTVAKGNVVSQLPEAGSVLVPGATVTLTVSKGPEPQPEPETPAVPVNPDNPVNHTWSGWESSLPTGVNSSGYYIEQKTQYRYRTRETMESTEAAVAGWSQYNSTSSWGAWGNWKDWSTYKPTSSDSIEVQTKKQYRYRDLQTTTSTESSLSGWTQTGSSSAWSDYGGWSGWQDSAVSGSDSRQVESRQAWGYYYFKCNNCGKRMHGWGAGACYTWAGGCGADIAYETATNGWFTTSWDAAGLQDWYGTGKYYTYSLDGSLWFKWVDPSVPRTQYRYRDRSLVTTYSYEKWGDWSSWYDSSYSESATRKVEQREVYRYRERYLNYLYYYERWSNWSEYGDTPISAGGNTDVQTRTLYRYMEK